MIVKRQNKPLKVLIYSSQSAAAKFQVFNPIFGEDTAPKDIIAVKDKTLF